ncbi:uncharacterized protein A4U43_C04F16430 [Asparagus officinalis]|uniref:Transcriptional regulator n=1 Tax=Asparagus officinalis TaxID=4686 RepID=A0A5P1F1U5_ASPOF|nr:uncharacterized protein A4U43_C04F16430 [Asparagus officinalis]
MTNLLQLMREQLLLEKSTIQFLSTQQKKKTNMICSMLNHIDTAQGFQGVITNKRIEWDVFKELDQQLEPLKMAPLFYGGPVRTHGLPLVSLAQKPVEGYVKITSDIYFGNPLATRLAIEGIQSGEQSASDFWFFLGYSSWRWNQLFDELATGAWYLNEMEIGNIDWPDG